MARYPVVVEARQYMCCGDPFRVGDEVEWTLHLTDYAGTFSPAAWRVSLEGAIVELGSGGRAVQVGNLIAELADGAAPEGSRPRTITVTYRPTCRRPAARSSASPS
jgi:hypothetical protein